jgi:hypothetical protein
MMASKILSETHSRVMRIATYLIAGVNLAQDVDNPDAQQDMRATVEALTSGDQLVLLNLSKSFAGLSAVNEAEEEEESDGDD